MTDATAPTVPAVTPVTAKEAAAQLALLLGLAREYARSLSLQKCPAVATAVQSQADRSAQVVALFIEQNTPAEPPADKPKAE